MGDCFCHYVWWNQTTEFFYLHRSNSSATIEASASAIPIAKYDKESDILFEMKLIVRIMMINQKIKEEIKFNLSFVFLSGSHKNLNYFFICLPK